MIGLSTALVCACGLFVRRRWEVLLISLVAISRADLGEAIFYWQNVSQLHK